MRTTFETTLSFIRYIAHAGIVDKGGVPYWQHPVRVAMNIGNLFPEHAQDEEILMAALLHDVMEDTEYEYADLAKMGYTERTLNICQWLDKNSIRYQNMTYLGKIKYMAAQAPEEVLVVKMADLTDNMDESRPWPLPANQKARYKKALGMLLLAPKFLLIRGNN